MYKNKGHRSYTITKNSKFPTDIGHFHSCNHQIWLPYQILGEKNCKERPNESTYKGDNFSRHLLAPKMFIKRVNILLLSILSKKIFEFWKLLIRKTNRNFDQEYLESFDSILKNKIASFTWIVFRPPKNPHFILMFEEEKIFLSPAGLF